MKVFENIFKVYGKVLTQAILCPILPADAALESSRFALECANIFQACAHIRHVIDTVEQNEFLGKIRQIKTSPFFSLYLMCTNIVCNVRT